MPKERLHLLIADEALTLLSRANGRPPLGDRQRFFYLFGAISADTFFYDVPTFRTAPIGDALHRRLSNDWGFFKNWLEEKTLSPEAHFWLLGLAAHLATDALWHPLIDGFSDPPAPECRELGLCKRHCHHWLEAELEAFWLARLGPPDGYRTILREFWRAGRAEFIRCYQRLLERAASPSPATAPVLARCLFLQVFLLRQFSHPFWQALRPPLLARKPTRPFGALIVPIRPPQGPSARKCAFETLCDPAFMARSAMSLANLLSALGVRS
jgi:hypothetical protein